MKPSLHTLGLWYTPVSAVVSRVVILCEPGAFCAAAYKPTPRRSRSRAILKYVLRWRASHVRTDRPHPPLKGLGLARVALRPPVASLPTRTLTARGPVRRLCLSTPFRGVPAPEDPDRGFATRASAAWKEPHQGAFAPLGTLTRAVAPLTTRRRFSHPGTHDQSLRALDDAQGAFMPLHPDEGTPLDPPPDKTG